MNAAIKVTICPVGCIWLCGCAAIDEGPMPPGLCKNCENAWRWRAVKNNDTAILHALCEGAGTFCEAEATALLAERRAKAEAARAIRMHSAALSYRRLFGVAGNPVAVQFQQPRGRWVSGCRLAAHSVLLPRNNWTPRNVAVAAERSRA